MSTWLIVAGGASATLVLAYFAFVILRLARDRDADGEFASYADRPWGKTDPAVPLPYVVLVVALGIVGLGLLVRALGAFEAPLGPRAYPTMAPYYTPPSFQQPQWTPIAP